jgi:glycosyltransferase involved in cell wall biosynthesis
MGMNMAIAVLIPCYNEALTIQEVIIQFRRMLPQAMIYVYDNGSTDNTLALAKQAGAIIHSELQRGKGHVVRRMFRDIDADVYLLVDGDNTYDANYAPPMIQQLVEESLDMVVGARCPNSDQVYRPGHVWGNRLFNTMIHRLFGRRFEDIFSGYRVFSKRFVKSFPCLSMGFEIETEISVHALALHLPVAEIQTPYSERPMGSVSKLKTYQDGFKILFKMIHLYQEVKPLVFFGVFGFLVFMGMLFLSMPVLMTYFETGWVPRYPTVILAAALLVISILSVWVGIILEGVSRARLENKQLHYLGKT